MITKEFLLAGNSTFTVSNDKNCHYTFKVRQNKSKPDMFFVSWLFGPHNESDYAYAGVIFKDRQVLVTTKASKIASDSIIASIFNFTMRIVDGTQECPDGYNIQHSGNCGKCGRKLTTPESIDRGLGPVCAERI